MKILQAHHERVGSCVESRLCSDDFFLWASRAMSFALALPEQTWFFSSSSLRFKAQQRASDEGKSKVRPLDRAIAIRNKIIVFMRKHFCVEYRYPLGFILILGIRYLYLCKATLLSMISSSFVVHVLPSSLLLLTLITSSRVKVLFV